MTGIMVAPPSRRRLAPRKAIVPVLIEIVVLNLLLAAAMNAALPNSVLLSDGTRAESWARSAGRRA